MIILSLFLIVHFLKGKLFSSASCPTDDKKDCLKSLKKANDNVSYLN